MSEAERLLDSMEADLGKKQLPCVVATIKERPAAARTASSRRPTCHASRRSSSTPSERMGATSSCTSSRVTSRGRGFLDFGGVVCEMFVAVDPDCVRRNHSVLSPVLSSGGTSRP